MAKRLSVDLNLATAILLAIASFLFLLICLSAPVLEAGQLFRLLAFVHDGSKRYVQYGLWGYCISPIPQTDPNVVEGCSKPMFGLAIDDNVIKALQAHPSVRSIINKHLTSFFILYPVVTLLTLVTCCLQVALYMNKRDRKRWSQARNPITLTRIFAFGSITMLITLIATAAQITIVGKTKLRVADIRSAYGNIYLEWGNLVRSLALSFILICRVWLTVTGTIIHFTNLANLFMMRLSFIRIEIEIEKRRTHGTRPLDKINEVREQDLINPPLSQPSPRSLRAPTS